MESKSAIRFLSEFAGSPLFTRLVKVGLLAGLVVVCAMRPLLDRFVPAAPQVPSGRQGVTRIGALLAAGLTIWIAIKALLNIAVMTAVVPPTGSPLPFISFGGSSLVVLLAGTGLLLSVSRVRARQTLPKWSAQAPEKRNVIVAPERRRPRVTASVHPREQATEKPKFVE